MLLKVDEEQAEEFQQHQDKENVSDYEWRNRCPQASPGSSETA